MLKTSSLQLVTGVVLSLATAAFALYGRPVVERLSELAAQLGRVSPKGPDQEDQTDQDQGDRP